MLSLGLVHILQFDQLFHYHLCQYGCGSSTEMHQSSFYVGDAWCNSKYGPVSHVNVCVCGIVLFQVKTSTMASMWPSSWSVYFVVHASVCPAVYACLCVCGR